MSLLEVSDGGIIDSESTVPISTINDVTISRAIGTIYTNTTGRSMYVLVTGRLLITVLDTQLLLIAEHNFIPGGIRQNVSQFGWDITKTNGEYMRGSVIMIVPPACTYKLTKVDAGGTIELLSWIEVY